VALLVISYQFFVCQEFQFYVLNVFFLSGVRVVCLFTCFAEMQRLPYDFSEGESELVSGFNTEYGSGEFAFIFLAEYSRIIFMGVFYLIFFFGGLTIFGVLKLLLFCYFVI